MKIKQVIEYDAAKELLTVLTEEGEIWQLVGVSIGNNKIWKKKTIPPLPNKA